MTVSVTVATESPHVLYVSIDVDLSGPYTFGGLICFILTEGSCSANLTFTRRELAYIKVKVYYGCTTVFRHHTIAIGGMGKSTSFLLAEIHNLSQCQHFDVNLMKL